MSLDNMFIYYINIMFCTRTYIRRGLEYRLACGLFLMSIQGFCTEIVFRVVVRIRRIRGMEDTSHVNKLLTIQCEVEYILLIIYGYKR